MNEWNWNFSVLLLARAWWWHRPFLALLWGARTLERAWVGCPAILPGMGHMSGMEGKMRVLTNHLSVSVTEEAEDPACIPIFWVSKWVDYSDKYGLGRLLPEWAVAQV